MLFHQSEKLGREDNEIFVFGSNLAGRHGKGAALHAAKVYGVIRGIGEGEMGKSYAIPTKDQYLRPRSLSEIERSVLVFLGHAKENPRKTFGAPELAADLQDALTTILHHFSEMLQQIVFFQWNGKSTCVDSFYRFQFPGPTVFYFLFLNTLECLLYELTGLSFFVAPSPLFLVSLQREFSFAVNRIKLRNLD
jgi:hypothetical protein